MHLPSDQHEEASYIIFKKDGDILARNGDSGNIEFSGTDATAVIEDAIAAGGKKIYLKSGITYVPSGNEIPGVSFEGEDIDNVVISSADPTTDNLSMAPLAEIINVTVKTAKAPNGLAAGDPRRIHYFLNARTTTSITPMFWPEQSIDIHVSEPGEDRPGVSVTNEGTGDAFYSYSENGACYRAVVPTGSDNPLFYALRRDADGTLHPILGILESGGLRLYDTAITLNNGLWLKWKDSGGTTRSIMKLHTNDEVQIKGRSAAPGTAAGRVGIFTDNEEFHIWDSTVGQNNLRVLSGGEVRIPSGFLNPQQGVHGNNAYSLSCLVNAGAIDDTVVSDPRDGQIGIDSTNGRFYFRYGGAWHYVSQTAGFQIPKEETECPICGEKIKEGDFTAGQIDEEMEDGALHGLRVHLKCATEEMD